MPENSCIDQKYDQSDRCRGSDRTADGSGKRIG